MVAAAYCFRAYVFHKNSLFATEGQHKALKVFKLWLITQGLGSVKYLTVVAPKLLGTKFLSLQSGLQYPTKSSVC